MAKIRTVKPELFRHEDLLEAEKKYQLPLRLAFIGLFTCCDREGRFRWRPRALKLDVLPYDDEIDFSQVLDALWEAGFIKKYRCEEKYYGYIPSWRHHQSINTREPISKLPDPAQCPHESYSTAHAAQTPLRCETAPIATDKSKNSVMDITQKTLTVSPLVEVEQKNLSTQETIQTESPTPSVKKIEVQEKPPVTYPLPEQTIVRQNQHPTQLTTTSPVKHRSINAQDILNVFQYWKTTLHHPQAVLDKKRHRLIQQGLQLGYSVTQLCDAISGCALTPYNMGNNDRGQRYDGLHIILGSADQIDRFIGNFKYPPKPSYGLDKRTQSNVAHLQNWLDKKMQPVHCQEQHQ